MAPRRRSARYLLASAVLAFLSAVAAPLGGRAQPVRTTVTVLPAYVLEPSALTPGDLDGFPPAAGPADVEEALVAVRLVVASPVANPTLLLRRANGSDGVPDLAIDEGNGTLVSRNVDELDGYADAMLAPGTYTVYFNIDKGGYDASLPESSAGASVTGDLDTFVATLRGANIADVASRPLAATMESAAPIDQNDLRWLETAPDAVTALPGESFTVRVKYEQLSAVDEMLAQGYYQGHAVRLDRADFYYYDSNGADPGTVATDVPAGWNARYSNQTTFARTDLPSTLSPGDRWVAEFTFTVVGPGSSRFVPYLQTRSAGAPWRVDSGYRHFDAEVRGRINAAALRIDKGFAYPKVVSGPEPPVAGDTTTYQLKITTSNTGLEDATNTVVTDVIPAGVTFVSLLPASQGTASYDPATRTLTWTIGTLRRDPDGPGIQTGGSATLDVQVSVTPTAAQKGLSLKLNDGAVATGTSKGCGLALQVTSTPVSTSPVGDPAHQMTITTSVDKATASPGAMLTYVTTYANTGNQPETGVIVSDVLPGRTTFVSASDNGAFDPATRAVTWNVGSRPVSTSSYQLSLVLALDAAFPAGTTPVSNASSIRSDAVPQVTSAAASTLVTTSASIAPTSTNGKAPQPMAAVSFGAGSLIIPMDTDTSGNHASYNQNLGMWKAYGLVYRLLANGIPVSWAITQDKTYNAIDFTAGSVADKRTGTSLGSWSYRGGPFVIDSAYAAAAMPIIQAWWAANGNQPNVHEAQAGFTANVDIVLRTPPRIANEAINAGITIAYYNAAGIPDLNGNAWTTSSPNILDEAAIAGGALFQQGVCTARQFDTFVTPHNSGYSYSLTDPNNLGTRTYAQLDTFVNQGGGWTALCHSILSNENFIRDLTVNGSTAVKSLFMTSKPGGVPGGFLTSTGFSTISNTTGGGTWTISSSAADLPVAQAVSTTVAQALPGGSVQTWPATGTGAPTYFSHTERVGYFDAATDEDNIIAGTYHDGTGLGKLTYIGGHSFSTAVPYSGNFEAPYLRAFYNSLFFNGAAVAKLDLTYSPTTFPQGGTQPMYVTIENTGASTATSVTNVTVTLNSGFTYVATTAGPAPTTVSGQTLTWASLGNIAGGTAPVTIQVAVDTSIAGTAGLKQFGTFHATYGDIYAEGFTADVCRSVQVSPVPAPALTKTPAVQGPVNTGSPVTWTLTYGNTGDAALNSAVLQDTLPLGFTYVSSSSSPALGAPLVIPGSPTIIRWTAGLLPAGTTGRTVTITALAGAVATPPTQTFTNRAALTGTDATNQPYGTTATAQVSVVALPLSLGKTVDQAFLSTLPGTVTYTIRPKYEGQALLTDARILDPLPTGVTYLSAGQGGSDGAYVPWAAVNGVENDGTAPDTTISLSASPTTVATGGTVTVTMTVTSNAAVSNVTPDALTASDGTSCTGPSPASQNIGTGGTITFTYTCVMPNLGEVTFTAAASGTSGTDPYDFTGATSNSVLVSSNGASNVVSWTLGSNAPGSDNSVVTGGVGDGIYAFRGSNTGTFWRYDIGTSDWSAKAAYGSGVEEGGSLAYDGGGYVSGYIYGLAGNGTKTFKRYDIDANSWGALANTPENVGDGGALVYLGGYVYAVRGAGKPDFWRYDPTGNTWVTGTTTPSIMQVLTNVGKGGALTTDGTNLYLLVGNGSKQFYRYNVGTNTWTRLADIGAGVGRGGALTRIGKYLYATVGNGSNKFYRYDITGGTWSPMMNVLGGVKDGGALTTDGTYVYALQGNGTKNFYKYTPSSNTWTTLKPTLDTVKSNGGGALAFVPGNATTIRTTSVDAMNRLVVGGDTMTVVATVRSTNDVTGVTPTLVIQGSGGASATCGAPVPATLNLTGGVPATFTYSCTATAGTNAGGSVVFKVSATGGGGATFAQATSNSVLVTPPLTFQATVPIGAPTQVVNAAFLSASGQTVSSPPVTTNTGRPTLTIAKSNSPESGVNVLPGGAITYTMLVQNVGSGNATGVTVTDSVPANTAYASCTGGTSCSQSSGIVTWTIGTLAPGDTATVTMTVNVSASLPISSTPHIITNTATVASTQVPTPVASNAVTNQVHVVPSISKSVTPEEAATGDTLTYTLVISNPGTTFTGTVSDPVPAGTSYVSCSPTPCALSSGNVTWTGVTIPPGTTTFTFTATVTAAGGVTVSNTALLDPMVPDLAPIGSNEVDVPIGPNLAVVKTVSPSGEVTTGSTLTYTLVVSNESGVAATGTVVTDAVPTGTVFQSCTASAGTCHETGGVVTFSVGHLDAWSSASVGFVVQVGSLPPGTLQIQNVAHVTANNSSTPVPSNVVSNAVAGMGTLQLLLEKSASPTTYNAVGDVITYSYVITNLGSAVLHGFAVTDNKVTVTCPATPTTLAMYQTITCTASHTITQADIDAGSITNTATASAKDPTEQTVTSNPSSTTLTAAHSPSMAVVKTSATTAISAPGSVSYTMTVTNTGNVALDAVTVTDPMCTSAITGPSGDTDGDGKLDVTETWVYTCSHTVTQAEIDAGGHLSNTATADSNRTDPVTDTLDIPITQTRTLSIHKTVTETSYSAVGNVLHYSFVVTNTGNVTLHGVSVADDKATNESCPTGDLAPSASMTCTASYAITQADLDAGHVTNSAYATDGTTSSAPSTATVNAVQTPALTLAKAASPTSYSVSGTEITYTYTITNTGNVTLAGPFSVTDSKLGTLTDCATGPLAPTAHVTCTATHTTTATDLEGGNIVNTATASGNSTTSNQATATVTKATTPIDAVNDTGGPVIGMVAHTGVIANVLSNDTLNGVAVNPSDVILTTTVADPTGKLTLNANGSVDIAAGAAAGTYTLTYQICQVLNVANCDTATATVTVTTAPIDAVNDAGSANGYTGGTAVADVLTNDTLNGSSVVPSEVTTTQISTTNPGVTLSGTSVVVAPGTPAGVYTVVYRICEVLNPTNCDSANVTVTVSAAAIDAVNDSGSADGTAGGTAVTNVLANDTLNGLTVVPSQVTLTQVSTTNAGVTLSGSSVLVAPGTPAGTYTLVYQICEVLNPTNCDTASVTVTVTSAGGLLGVQPGAPTTVFGLPGTTTYNAGTDLFSVTATPQFEQFGDALGTKSITTPRGLTINIMVDETGALIGGVAGNDFTLTGTIPGTSYSGVLLTGEIVAFGSQNVSSIDVYDFRFHVTGGALAPLYGSNDIGIRLTSENSTFTGSFTTSFSGRAKGTVGPIPPLIARLNPVLPALSYLFARSGTSDSRMPGLRRLSSE